MRRRALERAAAGERGGLGLGAGATVGEKRLAGPWLRPRLSRSFGSVLYGPRRFSRFRVFVEVHLYNAAHEQPQPAPHCGRPPPPREPQPPAPTHAPHATLQKAAAPHEQCQRPRTISAKQGAGVHQVQPSVAAPPRCTQLTCQPSEACVLSSQNGLHTAGGDGGEGGYAGGEAGGEGGHASEPHE